MRNAQISIEAVLAIAILLLIFLCMLVLIGQKTESGKPLIDESRNFAECQRIAEIILAVQTADAITEQTLTIENNARIKKNNIIIGQTSCNYFGKVEGDDTENGVMLENGNIKISKSPGGKIYAINISQ